MLHSFTVCRIITVCIGLILHGNFVEDYDYFVSKLTENPQLTHACPFDIWRNQTQYACTYRSPHAASGHVRSRGAMLD